MRVMIVLEVDDAELEKSDKGYEFHLRNALCHLLSYTSPEYPKDASLPVHCKARYKGVDTQITVEEDKPCQ